RFRSSARKRAIPRKSQPRAGAVSTRSRASSTSERRSRSAPRSSLRETDRRRVARPIEQGDVAGFLDEASVRHRRDLGEDARPPLAIAEADPYFHELVIGQRLVELLAKRVGDAARADVDDRCQGMTED